MNTTQKPFQPIRNFFKSFFQPIWNDEQEYWYTYTDRSRFGYYPNDSAYLSQRELQLLQSVLARNIRVVDQVRKEIKEEALMYEVGDIGRSHLFKEHREVKAYLKKLAELQHRLKHKIAAIG